MSPIRSLYVAIRERIAFRLALWSLNTLFGECETYVWDDFPDEPDLECISCHATKVIRFLREAAEDERN